MACAEEIKTEAKICKHLANLMTDQDALDCHGATRQGNYFASYCVDLTLQELEQLVAQLDAGQLPLDQLKIDQGFIKDILVDQNDAAIARMVIALAESLGLRVIAEGVEQEAQRAFLANCGCRAYQGYLMAPPVPIADFEAMHDPSVCRTGDAACDSSAPRSTADASRP